MTRRFYSPFRFCSVLVMMMTIFCLAGCGSGGGQIDVKQASGTSFMKENKGVLRPESTGVETQGNAVVTYDTSNTGEGYFVVSYKGDNPKVKLTLECPGGQTYKYNLKKGDACLPLTGGDGTYHAEVYENIEADEYALAYAGDIQATITNTLGPWLYPNLYVDFSESSQAVSLARQLAGEAECDLEMVGKAYHYVVANITYDDAKATNVDFDYLPDVDAVLASKQGICFDYAALMAALLRSQGIPTKLHIGYAGDAYHAWISVFVQDVGWIDGIIQFDGTNWSLMDATFAANAKGSKEVKKFIGDGSNYTTLYTY